MNDPGDRLERAELSSATTRILALVVGVTGVLSAGLVLANGVGETGALIHERVPYFDFSIFHWQVRQLDQHPFTVSQRSFYPPFALVVLRPFAWLPLAKAQALWLALQAPLGCWLMAQCARALAPLPPLPRWGAAFGFVAASLPLWHGIGAGQVSLLLTVLAIAGLTAGGQRAPAALGAAAAFKLYPLIFVLPYVLRLRFDYLRRFALWFLGLGGLLPLALLPLASVPLLWQRVWAIASNQQRPLYDESQSLRALLERLFHSRTIFAAPIDPLLFELPYPALAALITVATLAIAVITALRLRTLSPSSPLSTALVLCAFTLVVDPGWSHYFVALSYAQPVLLIAARGRRGPLALCAASFALSSGPLIAAVLQPALLPRLFQLSAITFSALLALFGLWWVARLEPASAHRGVAR